MTAPSSRPDPPSPPLSKWIIWVGALIVLAIAVVVVVVSWFMLRRLYGGQGAQVQLDVIRTAGTLVIGTGGAVALLLTARRQRYTELDLVHTARDAAERRVTELYFKAVEQLKSDQALAREGGLYALERLANSAVGQRQTMVNMICTYLCRAHTPPPSQSPQQEERAQWTAQDILLRNLRVAVRRREHVWNRFWNRTPRPAIPAWPRTRLDLSGTLLREFSLKNCQVHYADFGDAMFADGANFELAKFAWMPWFSGVQFTDLADFNGTQFTGGADFKSAQFASGANFRDAKFTGTSPPGTFSIRSTPTPTIFLKGAKIPLAATPNTVCGRGAGRPDPLSRTKGKIPPSGTWLKQGALPRSIVGRSRSRGK